MIVGRVFKLVLLACLAAATGCVSSTLPKQPWSEYVANCPELATEPPLLAASTLYFVSARLPDCRQRVKMTNYRTDRIRYGFVSNPDDDADLAFLSFDNWKQELAPDAGNEGLIIYVHGYRTSAGAALARARAIQIAGGDDRPVIAFLWPSQAALLKYTWDEANAEWTTAYARGLLATAVQLSDKVTIVGHSMGNRLVLDAVRDLWRSRPAYARRLQRLVLASPDTDRAVLERDLLELEPSGIPITVYASERDTALQYSWRVHGHPRGGDLSKVLRNSIIFPPRDPHYPVLGNARAELVDTTPVRAGLQGHADFIESREGAADLCRVLNGIDARPGRIEAAGVNAWVLRERPPMGDHCEKVGLKAAASLE